MEVELELITKVVATGFNQRALDYFFFLGSLLLELGALNSLPLLGPESPGFPVGSLSLSPGSVQQRWFAARLQEKWLF